MPFSSSSARPSKRLKSTSSSESSTSSRSKPLTRSPSRRSRSRSPTSRCWSLNWPSSCASRRPFSSMNPITSLERPSSSCGARFTPLRRSLHTSCRRFSCAHTASTCFSDVPAILRCSCRSAPESRPSSACRSASESRAPTADSSSSSAFRCFAVRSLHSLDQNALKFEASVFFFSVTDCFFIAESWG